MSSSSTGRMTRSASASSARSIRATRTGSGPRRRSRSRRRCSCARPAHPARPSAHRLRAGLCQPRRRNRRGGLERMLESVRDRMSYVKGRTHVGTSAPEAWSAEAGVCQDHAHVFLACCARSACRHAYASGYLFTAPTTRDGEPRLGRGWQEDGAWHGLDVTNGVRAGARHIRLASGSTISMRARYAACPRRAGASTCSPRLRHRRSARLRPAATAATISSHGQPPGWRLAVALVNEAAPPFGQPC